MLGFSSPLSLTITLSFIHIRLSYKQAIELEYWKKVMEEELQALKENQSWKIMACPPSVKPIESKWVFSMKLYLSESLVCYKA